MTAATLSPLEMRLQSRMDRRDVVQGFHENLLRERGDGNLSETDRGQIANWRSEIEELDSEIAGLASDQEAHRAARERSEALRRAMRGSAGLDPEGDAPIYRSMSEYARDVLLTRESPYGNRIRQALSDDGLIDSARARLELYHRTPANTLSSDVAGLQPEQHIAQIFQIIDTSRPLVATALRSNLERGVLTYPKVTQRPVVAVQASEKTEAGNQKMIVTMEDSTASVYLGGGDLSWQAINWSTPNALDLWFRMAAADYALKTEQDAAQALQHSAFTYNAATLLSGTPTYAQFLASVGSGGAEVFANSGRVADTIYMSIDRYWYMFGLSSDQFAQFITVSDGSIGPLRVVPSRGMDSGVIVVGDSQGLLVAETAGAPVELNVVEPAIGGVEVGIIGGFEAVVVDDGAFAMITTAS